MGTTIQEDVADLRAIHTEMLDLANKAEWRAMGAASEAEHLRRKNAELRVGLSRAQRQMRSDARRLSAMYSENERLRALLAQHGVEVA